MKRNFEIIQLTRNINEYIILHEVFDNSAESTLTFYAKDFDRSPRKKHHAANKRSLKIQQPLFS